MDIKLECMTVIGFILNGLSESYRYLVMNLESQVKTISYEDLATRLMDKEKHMVGYGNVSAERYTAKVHIAKSGHEERTYYHCHQPEHFIGSCPETPKSIQYNCCGKLGYKEANCKVKEFQEGKGKIVSGLAIAGAY